MRRFIVGLLATIGFITILGIGGVLLLGSVMGGSRPAPSDRTVLKLDWRQLPGEDGGGGGTAFSARAAPAWPRRSTRCAAPPPTSASSAWSLP